MGKSWLLLVIAIAAMMAASSGTAIAANAPAGSHTAVSHQTPLTSEDAHRHIHPNATLTGDCGTITFVNYYNGNFYIIIDSSMGGILKVDWSINASDGGWKWGTNWDNGNPHFEFALSPSDGSGDYMGGVATLYGTVTTVLGACTITPNPS